MEKKHEITEKQLAFLEGYLKRKKKALEPEDLYELMDHIIVDFEYKGNGNISQHLADNSSFIFNYKGSSASKQESIHWSYQKDLWRIFLNFFHKKTYIPYTIFGFLFLYILFIEFNFSIKIKGGIFMALIILPLFYSIKLTYHKNLKIRKLISFKYLGNIMSLPSLFLYLFSPVSDFIKENSSFMLIYVSIAIILCYSGVLLISEKRKIILEKHKHLLS